MTVSKLRFPSPSSLVSHKLGTLTRWSSGGTPSKANKLYWEGDISWFTAASMKSNKLSFSPTKISKLGLKNGSRLANKNDILLLVRGSMLFNKIPVGILLNDAAFNQDVKAIKCLGEFNHEFALQWFLSKEPHLLSMVTGTGIGAGKLDTSELQDLDVYLPDCKEQSRIANFLSCIDDKITLLDEQYVQLCQYKKGMMQKIFSQELRFKDDNGKPFPKWNTLKLKDVAIRVTRKNKENNNTILTISGRDGLVDQMTYFNKQIASKNVTGYYLIREGEFAYNKSYSQGYPMGAIKMLSNYEKGVVSTLYICFKLNDEQSCDFYQHYFESGLQNRAIEKVAQEGARNHGLLNIGVNDFFDIELQVPSLAEQNKIARFLSAIEDKIAIKKAELDKLKTWKQGLLQQMFV